MKIIDRTKIAIGWNNPFQTRKISDITTSPPTIQQLQLEQPPLLRTIGEKSTAEETAATPTSFSMTDKSKKTIPTR